MTINNLKDWFLRAAIAVSLAWLLMWKLTGCYTPQKAEKQIGKANYKYPTLVAKKTRELYPCTLLFKTDTLTQTRDSTIYIDVECPDTANGSQSDYAGTDTVYRTVVKPITKTVRVPVNMPVQTKIVNRYFEDSAKIFLLTEQLIDSSALIFSQRLLISELQEKNKKKGHWIIGLGIGLLALIAILVYIVKRR